MDKYLLVFLLLATITLFAQEFKSGAAIMAREKYKAELRKVEDIKIAAEKQLKKELEAALASAMKAGNLDEANEIKSIIDQKVGSKDEKSISNDDKEKEASKLALKVSDKHNGIIGSRPYKDKYTLNLRAAKQKKIIITMTGESNQSQLAVFSVFVNNELAGNWEIKNEPQKAVTAKSFDIDITAFIKEAEIKEYEITFKTVTMFSELNISEVKATYK